MKIRGTEWYTANAINFIPVEGGGRKVQTLYGYRMPVSGKKDSETEELMALLKADGVENIKLKTSKHDHSGIPKGTPFLEVLDEESVIALEQIFLKQGIELPTDRYKEYGLEYIKRQPTPLPVKKSWLDRILGR